MLAPKGFWGPLHEHGMDDSEGGGGVSASGPPHLITVGEDRTRSCTSVVWREEMHVEIFGERARCYTRGAIRWLC
jgi:hypothetical protein